MLEEMSLLVVLQSLPALPEPRDDQVRVRGRAGEGIFYVHPAALGAAGCRLLAPCLRLCGACAGCIASQLPHVPDPGRRLILARTAPCAAPSARPTSTHTSDGWTAGGVWSATSATQPVTCRQSEMLPAPHLPPGLLAVLLQARASAGSAVKLVVHAAATPTHARGRHPSPLSLRYVCPTGPDGQRRDKYERPELCQG